MKIRILSVTFLSAFVATSLTSLGRTPQAKVTCRVLDDSGNAVTGAVVNFSTFKKAAWASGSFKTEFTDVTGGTDTNGYVTLSIPCIQGEVSCSVYRGNQGVQNKYTMVVAGTDYYLDYGKKVHFTNQTSDRWQPWNPTIELILRQIRNPIPMYARKLHGIPIPAIGEPLRYDLEKGDWLSPYGNGQVADFLFYMDCQFGRQLSAGENVNEFHATLTMTFPNEKDGIVEISDPQPPLEGSIFRLPRFAPEVGYSNRWSVYGFETEGQMGFKNSGSCENPSYFYRVRTKTNETGQIISAHYGKIRGPITFGVYAKATSLSLTYYFNPTPNDRNMEFDPSRNLFTDLPVTSQVRDP